MADNLASVAWLYKVWGSKVGVLQLDGGQLSLTLKDGRQVFGAPLDQVEVRRWGVLGMSPNSQVKLRIGGKTYRVCFVSPSNADENARLSDLAFGVQGAMLSRSVRALGTYPDGLAAGAAWHQRLSPGDAG